MLPTGAGKTYLAQLAMQSTPRSTLVLVPTLDLMQQWYAHLKAAFPDADVGLLGGGSRDRTQILVSTYDSAAIHAETLGNRYGLLVFDECHRLPSASYAQAARLPGLRVTGVDMHIGSQITDLAPYDNATALLAEPGIAEDPGRYRPIVDALAHNDRYLVTADFDGYWDAQRRVDAEASFHSPVTMPDAFAVMIMKI